MQTDKIPSIKTDDRNFGTILNCAVRYAIGRETYMPGLVIDFIVPLLPHVSDQALAVFDQDITDQKYMGGYGDPDIDEPMWHKFHNLVRTERTRRGQDLYVDWRAKEKATEKINEQGDSYEYN